MWLAGKKGLIFGVANHRSIAWGIAEQALAQGAQLYYAAANERMMKGVEKLIGDAPRGLCDVADDASMDAFFNEVREKFAPIDFVVHSVAFAPREELAGSFVNTTREGWRVAQDVSAYSLVALMRRALQLYGPGGGAAVTLSYLGSERAVENYNVMGPAKAALESAVRYLAADLGPKNVRINAISAGPVNTLSARGVSGFLDMLDQAAARAALRRNVTLEDLGKAAVFLLSDWSSGLTGEVLKVDCGFSIMGG